MSHHLRSILSATCMALLTACSGGEGGGGGQTGGSVGVSLPSAPVACSLEDQQSWVRNHIRQDYLWNTRTPDVAPSGFSDLKSYFSASLFQGDATIPKDRYSGFGPTPDYNLYYEQGITLGFGVAVAGQEVLGQPDRPLWVRYVEPGSPADLAGVRRGDRVMALNGVPTPQVISTQDFSALVAKAEGDALSIDLLRDGQALRLNLVAKRYELRPVLPYRVLSGPTGQRVGYLYLQAFLTQAEQALDLAFESLAAERVSELMIDLRYNTGGFVSVGERVASFVGGQSKNGLVYTDLLYNTNNRRLNTRYRFTDRLSWPGLQRVYILAGQRTCSASEQLISGLKGAGVDVIQVGDTTCGKPVGFNAREYCGNTFSVVMFESINAQGLGGYYQGIAPRCPVDEDWQSPLGDPNDPLLRTALQHMATGQCPVRAAQRRQESPAKRQWPWVEPMPPPTMR